MSDTTAIEVDTAGERHVCGLLKFWLSCRDRRCRRARACVGGSAADLPCCAAMDGAERAQLAALCRVFIGGGTLEESIAAGEAAAARYRHRKEIAAIIRDTATLTRRAIHAELRRMAAR